ncbi:hypothetical protein T484DRAFT_1635033, partial [Baffinella frigidus]
NPKPQTSNPKPHTPHPKPQTPNPTPHTPHPTPHTPHPTPHTPKPNPPPPHLNSCGCDGLVKIWDATTFALVHSLESPSEGGVEVFCVRFSPDGMQVAAGREGGCIQVSASTPRFRSKVDGFVPQTRLVNLTTVGQPE